MWTDAQLQQYRRDGYLRMPGLIDAATIARLRAVSDDYIARYSGDGPITGDDEHRTHYVKEKSGPVRTLFALHRGHRDYDALIRNPKIAGPLKQALGGDAYVYHSKVNVKDAFEGAVWMWHQDYGYWQYDGVDDRMASVLVMLDETTLHGGCMLFVPGSHKWGILEHHSDEKTTSYKQWCVTTPALRQHIMSDSDYVPVVGKPGDVYIFDCRTLHASGHNLAPASRQALIYAMAHIDNRPAKVEKPRPDWVVDTEFVNVTEHVKVELQPA